MKALLARPAATDSGILAVVKGVRRLERSDSGWPIVAISQLGRVSGDMQYIM